MTTKLCTKTNLSLNIQIRPRHCSFFSLTVDLYMIALFFGALFVVKNN